MGSCEVFPEKALTVPIPPPGAAKGEGKRIRLRAGLEKAFRHAPRRCSGNGDRGVLVEPAHQIDFSELVALVAVLYDAECIDPNEPDG